MKNIGQIDSVMMGADKDPNFYVSEAKQQFINKNGEAERIKGKKHEPSLDIGRGQGEYLTHNQDIYQNRFNQHKDSRLSNEEIQKLKGLNFTNGFQGIFDLIQALTTILVQPFTVEAVEIQTNYLSKL